MLKLGLNLNPVSCSTVKVSPKLTGVRPSASRTVQSDGRVVTVSVRAAEPKLVSTGAAMPIDVARLFSATESEVGAPAHHQRYSSYIERLDWFWICPRQFTETGNLHRRNFTMFPPIR